MQHEEKTIDTFQVCPICKKEMKPYVTHIHEIIGYFTPNEQAKMVSAFASITQNGETPAISDQFAWEVEIRATNDNRRTRILVVGTPKGALENGISKHRRKYKELANKVETA